MSAGEVDRKRAQEKESGGIAGLPDSGWRMPGGEDLLHFALSAGLAAGVWWLEHREEEAAAGPAPSPAGGAAHRESR